MSKSKKRRERKGRRNNRKVLKFGINAKPTHKSPSGRTGSVRGKQLKEKAINNRRI